MGGVKINGRFHLSIEEEFFKPSLRNSIWDVTPDLDKSYDQVVLEAKVWPAIREEAAVYDSYHCLEVERYGHSMPWPVRRRELEFVGNGPTKEALVEALRRSECPKECRPVGGEDWRYC